MNRDWVYLQHIQEAVSRIESYAAVGREVFLASPHWQDAVIRQLEVIGEATKRLSPDLRARNPENNHPSVVTSEPDALKAAYEALKALIPSARIHGGEVWWGSQTRPLMTRASLDRLNHQDDFVKQWLVAKFADLGWEPFSEEYLLGRVHLRKAFD